MNPTISPAARLTRGYLIALTSAVILSTTAILIRHLVLNYKIPALVLAFWRDSFAVITLVIILLIVRPALLIVPRRYLLYFLIYGLVLAVFNSLYTTSVLLNGAAISTVLSYSSTAFSVLLGWWLLKESLGWVKLVAVILSIGGCVLVAGVYEAAVWGTNLLAISVGVLTGVGYSAYSLMGRYAAQQHLNPWTTILYTFSFATVFLLLINILAAGKLPGTAIQPMDFFWLGDAWEGWGLLFLLGAVPTLVGYGLYNVSLGYLPSSVANLILSTEPVFTAIIAYLVLAEQLAIIQIGGSVLILGGVVLMRLFEKEPVTESEPVGV
jgi:drug/metabolite transporter (DMT)-like permease